MNQAHLNSVLSGEFTRTIKRAIDGERKYVEGVVNQAVRDGTVHGFVSVEFGESLIDLDFPSNFTERPVFTCGLELPDNEYLTYGAFPLWSATVARWKTINAGGLPAYAGAAVGLVLIGAGRTAELHYSFAGRSYTNPGFGTQGVGDVL